MLSMKAKECFDKDNMDENTSQKHFFEHICINYPIDWGLE